MNRPTISRRRLIGVAGATGAVGAVGAVGAAAGDALAGAGRPAALTSLGSTAVPFHGTHQAGIVQPAQARMYAAAFDLTPAGADRRALIALLRRWSDAAATMARGGTPPGDDQVALDAGPASLTVTFGFGASLFTRAGLGLSGQLPEALAPLPQFPNDAIDRSRSDGDLWVQVCADDALVAFHALRVLQRQAAGTARPRWQMAGFSRSPGATDRPRTVRNLMGQVDGSNNPQPSDRDFARKVFVPAGGSPAWMAGGSYAVFRRIRMLLDTWEQVPLARQERVIGRTKATGAPLSGGTEHTPVDLAKTDAGGALLVPGDAHIRVAAPASNQGAAMLRRGFSYHDGLRPDGTPDAGLLFVAFQADPLNGFVPVQRKLAAADALSQFIRHESSGLYAVPGGARPGGYVGQELMES
jgi:dye decolorizing peroxidase